MLVDNMFDGYFFINAAQAAADVPRFCVMFDYSFDCNRKNVFDHKLNSVDPSRLVVYQVSELLKASSICGRNCLPLIYRSPVGGSIITANPSISLIIPNILKAILRIWSSSISNRTRLGCVS